MSDDVFFSGTVGIIFTAPSHLDTRTPIDVIHSKIDKKQSLMKMKLDSD